jgi:hypothetical protein
MKMKKIQSAAVQQFAPACVCVNGAGPPPSIVGFNEFHQGVCVTRRESTQVCKKL